MGCQFCVSQYGESDLDRWRRVEEGGIKLEAVLYQILSEGAP